MRTVKILAGAAGAFVVLIGAALLAVWLWVNPNDYKGRIAAAVLQATGRDLSLKGDVQLSVFPWVALELGPASLGNPPGFGAEPFLAFEHAALRVRLWPLLSKRLVMDRVELDGLDLRLRRNAQGLGNWQSFGQARGAEMGGGRPLGAQSLQLAGIRVKNGRVSYQGMVVEKLDFESGAFGAGQGATPVSIAFRANRGVPGESLSVNAQFDLSSEVGAPFQQLRLQAVSFSGLLGRPGDGPPVHWELSAPIIEVDLAGQNVAVPAFALSYSSAHLSGKLQATKIVDDLSVTGSVALAPVVLQELAPRVGVVLPKIRDPRALAQLSAGGDFIYGANGLSLNPIELQLDDTHLKGSIALAGEPRALKFALTADDIDLDRYLGNAQASARAQGVAGRAGAAQAGGAAAPAGGAAAWPEADGVLAVGALHLAPLDFANVRLTLASKDRVLHLSPALAQIDGGLYSGDITLDQRGATPVLSMDEHLSGVDMARLLAGSSYAGRLSGRGTVNLQATARGASLEGIMRTLNGHFDASLEEGALEGVDLGYELARAQALVKHAALPPAPGKPPRTKFDAFKLSAAISDGVARTSDLTIATPTLRVTGQGSANLLSKAIDFQLLASVLKSPEASLADIPLKITGTYTDPTVRPDVEALAKGQIKQKLRDILEKNGLQGLFGK